MRLFDQKLTIGTLFSILVGCAPLDEDGDALAQVCSEYGDEDPGATSRIAIRNARDEPIFLISQRTCDEAYADVTNPDGSYWPRRSCEATCEDVMFGHCGCAPSCPVPDLLRIEPGAFYEVEWDGHVLVRDELDPACGGGVCGAGSCPRVVKTPAGDYEVRIEVLTAVEACAGGDPSACACDKGDNHCRMPAPGAGLRGEALTGQLTWPRSANEIIVD